ncbi:hypothetical protein CIK76_17145 [Glutamicibacter sp. BW80]|uniref:CDP-glycerol glycerophosphotransferase family protein n=1 Tax=Glutamicibacter sp. BW80 TaxID=2024404 RepID=UPI000BB77D9E|nr:CDP-glycerol glycerophosphotransferase family protein [Glutamicibacter sp. BW80]PCC27473.1 hypothetical protein CIK76_17145 [Glutamicibacter sp. BW80]
MRRLIIWIAKMAMAVVYWVLKKFTSVDSNKIVFLGRRMDRTPLDFKLLIEELRQQNPDIRPVVLSRMYRGGFKETLRFVPVLLKSIYHLATSKVCVLDSYWPAVSALSHRSELVVYQIWHSLGKIKQSGLQTLGRNGGHDRSLANVMKMHQGYDYVVAGAKVWNPNYVESFGVREDQLLNFGLPRADYLHNEKSRVAARIHKRYPELNQKPIVVYAPTFRRGTDADGARRLVDALPMDRFNLVIKMHGSDSLLMPDSGFVEIPDFTATELLSVTDYLVTDYSSIALEAAILDVNTLYFVYDREEYLKNNGMNINLDQEMPGCVFASAEELSRALERPYPADTLQEYKNKFISLDLGHSTSDLAGHILTVGELCSQSLEHSSNKENSLISGSVVSS